MPSSTEPNACDLDKGQKPDKDALKIWIKHCQGYSILIGKNALSNETLIVEHKTNHKKCLWLHAVCSRGPHVVLCVEGKQDPSESVMEQAAIYALNSSKDHAREVLYSPLQDVYKPIGSPLGVFRTWRTTTIKIS